MLTRSAPERSDQLLAANGLHEPLALAVCGVRTPASRGYIPIALRRKASLLRSISVRAAESAS